LIASINKSNLSRWNWLTQTKFDESSFSSSFSSSSDDFIVTMNPLEIRTFQITFV